VAAILSVDFPLRTYRTGLLDGCPGDVTALRDGRWSSPSRRWQVLGDGDVRPTCLNGWAEAAEGNEDDVVKQRTFRPRSAANAVILFRAA
jgi:hypothetical protein